MSTENFQPNWVSRPGQTIANLLEKRGISSNEFTERLDRKEDFALGLILGDSEIEESVAKKLAEILGGTAGFWLNRERNYRSELKRLAEELVESEAEEWLRSLSPKILVRKGWVALNPGENIVQACLRFFEVQSIADWRRKYHGELALASFRKSPSFATHLAPTAAWFRRCEVLAQQQDLAEWCPNKFSEKLVEIRGLVRLKSPEQFYPLLRAACASAGVAVVVEEAPQGCAASGATRFLSNGKPVIMLSLRHRTDDHFWFTFFHEAAHLLLHRDTINLDYTVDAEDSVDDAEREANDFSERILIPEDVEPEFFNINYNTLRTGKDILRFARKARLSPGVVVGQLQFRRNLSWRRLNSYKRHFEFEQFD